MGPRRFKWLIEAVQDLRNRLESKGSKLIVRVGKPNEVLSELVKTTGNVKSVYTHEEVYSEELEIMKSVKGALPCDLKQFWGGQTLVHWDDCPYETMSSFPNVYTQFRSKVEHKHNNGRELAVDRYVPEPATFKPTPSNVTTGDLPVVDANNTSIDSRSAVPFVGGETAALQRLSYYFKQKLPSSYKETRNGMLGADYSTKFSMWLATGSISARRIIKDLDRYEKNVESSRSTYWIWFELLWRDFFRYQGIKQGTKMFQLDGPQGKTKPWRNDAKQFEMWKQGKTGHPLVDANMVELKTTGFMSNRGRQIVASFLTKDMQLDWRLGGAYFEEVLIDYECGSNWGNWSYGAGVGCDPREDRYFSIPKQGSTYDGNADYMKTWLPFLKHLPATSLIQSRIAGVESSVYPNPPIIQLKFGGPKNMGGNNNNKWSNNKGKGKNNTDSNNNNANGPRRVRTSGKVNGSGSNSNGDAAKSTEKKKGNQRKRVQGNWNREQSTSSTATSSSSPKTAVLPFAQILAEKKKKQQQQQQQQQPPTE